MRGVEFQCCVVRRNPKRNRINPRFKRWRQKPFLNRFRLTRLLQVRLFDAGIAADGIAKGLVMRVDAFGNLITNFRAEDLPESALTNGEVKFQVGTQAVSRMVPTFASGNTGEPVAYIGSTGYVEIGLNKGNASRMLSIGRGTPVLLEDK